MERPPLGTLSQSQHTHTHTHMLPIWGSLCSGIPSTVTCYPQTTRRLNYQHTSAAKHKVIPVHSTMRTNDKYLEEKPTHTHTEPSESSYMLLVRRCYLEAALELPHPSVSTLVIVLVCSPPPFLTNVYSKGVCVCMCVC